MMIIDYEVRFRHKKNRTCGDASSVDFVTNKKIQLAEGVRFELTVSLPTPVFKTSALNRSATPPLKLQNLLVAEGKKLRMESNARKNCREF
jgi:hypothetical protein